MPEDIVAAHGGWEQALEVLSRARKQDQHNPAADGGFQGKPIYGMPGLRDAVDLTPRGMP